MSDAGPATVWFRLVGVLSLVLALAVAVNYFWRLSLAGLGMGSDSTAYTLLPWILWPILALALWGVLRGQAGGSLMLTAAAVMLAHLLLARLPHDPITWLLAVLYIAGPILLAIGLYRARFPIAVSVLASIWAVPRAASVLVMSVTAGTLGAYRLSVFVNAAVVPLAEIVFLLALGIGLTLGQPDLRSGESLTSAST